MRWSIISAKPAEPLVGRVVHPLIVATALLVLGVGLLVRSAMGRWIQRRLDQMLFKPVTGYKLAKAVATDQILVDGPGRSIRPALATIEEGQCPALVMMSLPTDGCS